jgi:hypothetical protein
MAQANIFFFFPQRKLPLRDHTDLPLRMAAGSVKS